MLATKAKARRILTRFCRVWLLAALLVGCATPSPKLVTTPDVCPGLPATPPQAHVTIPEFLPVLNQEASSAQDRASEVLRVRVESASAYQACRANNAALADWVIHHSEE